jgi:signal peptidase II
LKGTRLPPRRTLSRNYWWLIAADLNRAINWREKLSVMRKYHFLISLFVIALDRVTKWTIARRLSLHDSIQIIPGFFRIIHAENPGAAFGIFADSPSQWKVGMLIGFSIIALVIVSALLWKNSHTMTSTGIGLALILGGAVGNLWDRLVSRQVVDFLLFYVGPHQWPAFNVADSAIVVGAGLLVFEILFTKSPSQQSA